MLRNEFAAGRVTKDEWDTQFQYEAYNLSPNCVDNVECCAERAVYIQNSEPHGDNRLRL